MTEKIDLEPQQIIEPYLGKYKRFFSWKKYADRFEWKIKSGDGSQGIHKIRLEVNLVGPYKDENRISLQMKIGGYTGKKSEICEVELANPKGPKILIKRIRHLAKAVGISIK